MSSREKRHHSRSRSRSRHDKNKEKKHRESKWTDAPSKFTSAPKTTDSLTSNTGITKFTQKNSFTSAPISQPNPVVLPLQNSLVSALADLTKIKKKIYIPQNSGVNYVGLIIGPKGTYQKRLEQQSGCKILVRGKGTQKEGALPQPDDNEPQHILLIGDTDDNIKRATHLVEKILYADETTRNKIKEEQIKASQQIRTDLLFKDNNLQGIASQNANKPLIEKYLLTPYGPPDKNARILPVPNDCVGLIIGKKGETIRRLNRESGCKIQIAIDNVPNSTARNVFIEGTQEKYEVAKRLIEDIISEQISMKHTYSHLGENNPFLGPQTPLKIPNKMVGLIIGRGGETVKIIHESTGCYIFIPKESRPGEDFREIQLSGPKESVETCKKEIISMIHLALYGRLPYMNSQFYPYVDPVTRLPIIDPGIMAQLDPNSKRDYDNNTSLNNLYEMNLSDIKNIHENINDNSNENKNNDNNQRINQQQINQQIQQQTLMNKYQTFEQLIYQNSKFASGELDYDLEDYNNPLNYDLYYQSLYQMYPQMNDYYKKINTPDDLMYMQNPLILLNNSILENNNNMDLIENNRIIQKQLEKESASEEKTFKKILPKK